MIRIYSKNKEFLELKNLKEISASINGSIWIDLHNPEAEEIKEIEKSLDICLPTKDEMYGLEISNRLYQENDSYFMTIFVIVGSETPDPAIEPVTFAIAGNRLITLRYVDPQPFRTFISRKEKITTQNLDGKDIMFSLLENISERVADILEKHGHEIDDLSKKVFKPYRLKSNVRKGTNYERILKDIGHYGDIIAKSRESLVSISRLVAYLKQSGNFKQDEEEAMSVAIIESDTKALTEHAKFVASKINFLLEATLGMISIQQNNIIKIFTVATMMFLPPTLIASIYGMNFEYLPELHIKYGYYLALLLMALSAYIPYKLFKKRGWL
jgi:magnesium transporter